MSTATTATARAVLRGLQDRDPATLMQAAKNGRIVKELFEQEHQPLRRDALQEEMQRLAEDLQEIASLAVLALRNDDQRLQAVLALLPGYVETVLDDLTASPAKLFFLASKERPSRKRLPELRDEVILAMAASSSPDVIRSGMALAALLDHLERAIPAAERLLLTPSSRGKIDQQ